MVTMPEAGLERAPTFPRSAPERTLVLVVDDEEPLRRVVRRALEGDGCAVLEASDGEEALRLLQGLPRMPDLVLTDLRMPRVGGRELAEILSVFRPGVPVVAMTGFAGSAHPDRRLPLLIKPFTLPILLDAVRTARLRRAAYSGPRVELRKRARRLRHLASESGAEGDLLAAVGLLRGLSEEQ
jgi:CheY-like chemotaxis protein